MEREASCCHVRLCVAQLHSGVVRFNAQDKTYRLGRARFCRARILGVCVGLSRVQQQDTQLEIDDGTGVLNVQVAQSVLAPNNPMLQLGAMVDCLGNIDEPWPPSEATNHHRWLHATHINIAQDLNLEALRMLEILHLYESDYATSHSSGAVVLELLAFPSLPGVSEGGEPQTGVKRKASSLQQQQQREVCAIEQPRVSTVIEQPPDQRRSFVLPSETGVPPAEYHFKVSASDQQLIECGAKTLEIRLNVTPYSIIHVKDRITINGKVATTVVSIRKYSQLASALATESLDALLPQGRQSGAFSSPAKATALNASAAPLRHFRQFFSAEEEEQHGLVVFQLAVASSSAPKSMEDWTQRVYDQLATKRPAGCSMADLQFAFPTLPVDRIMKILTNMQMDCVVYILKDKYHLL